MRSPRLLLLLTLTNLILAVSLVLERARPAFAQGSALPMLRGSGLEIVDTQGRPRATITVLPPTVVESKRYPETVLFRLIDPKIGPAVKIGVASDGGAIGLTNGSDRGVQIFAHDSANLVRILDNAGKERVIRP